MHLGPVFGVRGLKSMPRALETEVAMMTGIPHSEGLL